MNTENTIITQRKIYQRISEAERYASMLENGDDDGWGYRVKELREGGYVIAVHDEDGSFIHYWGEE